MAGEFMVVNPRRRRRRRTASGRFVKGGGKRRRRRRTRLHARRNPVNPRRRRRRSSHRRRSYRRNPGLRLMPGLDLGAAAITAVGVIGPRIAADQLAQFLPADWTAGPNAPVVKIGLRAAIGFGVPMLARRWIGARTANLLMAGAAVGLVLDAYSTWIAPAMGVSGYETGDLGDYETGALGFDESSEMLGGSVYEGGAYD